MAHYELGIAIWLPVILFRAGYLHHLAHMSWGKDLARIYFDTAKLHIQKGGRKMDTVIAVGKHAHTIVGEDSSGDLIIPNTLQGAKAVITSNAKSLVFVGNHRWAFAFASALKDYFDPQSILFRKVTIEHGARGKLGSMVNVARHLRATDALDPQPFFFTEKKKETILPPLHLEALRYLEVTNEVRRAKHNLLDGLYVLFPEVVPQKSGTKAGEGFDLPKVSDVFATKKMARVLRDPRPEVVMHNLDAPENVRALAKHSLGLFLSYKEKEKEFACYKEHLDRYLSLLEEKECLISDLRSQVCESPLIERFGDGDVMIILTALLGDEIYTDWRKLRAFAGLALTRQESSGKKRISRHNGAIRQYLYLYAFLTKEGKEMAREIRDNADRRAIEAGKEKASNKTVKVIEGVLKRMRKAVRVQSERETRAAPVQEEVAV